MKLLEYEAKQILKEADVPVPKSEQLRPGQTPSFIPVVLKSQVPTGGRGKAGGIRIIQNKENVPTALNDIFNLAIKGYSPRTLLAEEPLPIQQEYYLSLLINKSDASIQIIAHKNGGIDVEENKADSFLAFSVSGSDRLTAGERLAGHYDLPEQSFALQDMVENLHRCFIKNDATLIEINPLIYTTDHQLVAGDCKMELDSAAAFRHPEWDFEDTPNNSSFVTLDHNGAVATIANGAGLAMATVDTVTDAGLHPANFLDIGGGANSESILTAFRKIMEYPNIRAIVINIFAGITRCDEVAKAIIEAKKQIANLPPLYIRLTGTNVEVAQELLANQGIPLLPNLEACLEAVKQEIL